MWALLTQAPATTQCVFFKKKKEWIDHSAFHEAPLRNAIVRFEPHVAVISLFLRSPRRLIFWLTLMM